MRKLKRALPVSWHYITFDVHNYKRPPIGYIEDLDAASLEDFEAFKEKWYMPNNAVLTVAGDINKKEARKLIEKYFASIPSGKKIERVSKKEPVQKAIKRVKEYDANIQLPALLFNYKTAPMNHRDAIILDMISVVLGEGKSARLQKRLVDTNKIIELITFNRPLEEQSVFTLGGILANNTSLDEVDKILNEEVVLLQTTLVSDDELEKVKNKFQSQIISENSDLEGIAENLAASYLLYDNTNRINEILSIVNSVTKKDIKAIAKKYLTNNNNVVIEYLPKK